MSATSGFTAALIFRHRRAAGQAISRCSVAGWSADLRPPGSSLWYGERWLPDGQRAGVDHRAGRV